MLDSVQNSEKLVVLYDYVFKPLSSEAIFRIVFFFFLIYTKLKTHNSKALVRGKVSI